MGGKWDKKKGQKMGQKMGQQTNLLSVPFPPFFRRSRICPTVPFVQISSPDSPTKKWEFLPLTNSLIVRPCGFV